MNDFANEYLLKGRDVLIPGSAENAGLMPEDILFEVSTQESKEAVDFLNEFLRKAVREKVNDIHIQQTDMYCRIRFRYGEPLVTVYERAIENEWDLNWMRMVNEKIRAHAHIPLSENRKPLDGRMKLRVDNTNIDVRVNITPGVSDGQLIVCRLLDQSNSSKRLTDIRMTPAVNEAIMRIIQEPNGLFLITGPTGSGKTTTLYAMLNESNDESRNIVTIEHPVEYTNRDFHQIPVDGRDVTFASALRAVLRQDPDIIMVGEIRDHETASIAVQAAITGHLVLSTLHANDTASAITRMIDLGIDPMTLAAALRGVTAQRLVQAIAKPAFVARTAPTEAEQSWLRANKIKRKEPTYPRIEEISDLKGRLPVMEVMLADRRVKNAMLKADAGEIYAAASRQPQFETLAQAAERLAYAGLTTLGEARRISSVQEAPAFLNKRLGQILVESGEIEEGEMEVLLEEQAQGRLTGEPKRLGEMLLEKGLCTKETLFNAIGYTAEAHDILQQLCNNDDLRQELATLVRKWVPGVESLFELAIKSELVSKKELENATQNY